MRNLSSSYDGVPALVGASLDVGPGRCVAVLGPNGAGKTTLLKSLSGTVQADEGDIVLDGEDLGALAAHERSRRGLIHVPQGRRVFASLSVRENLMLGGGLHDQAWRKERMSWVLELFPDLVSRLDHAAGGLSGGQQQMLAIGRGLMGRPRVLMLDEPSMGLAPRIVDEVFDRVAGLRSSERMSLIVAEQRVLETLDLCDHAYVLERGTVRAQGHPDELKRTDSLIGAYLGA